MVTRFNGTKDEGDMTYLCMLRKFVDEQVAYGIYSQGLKEIVTPKEIKARSVQATIARHDFIYNMLEALSLSAGLLKYDDLEDDTAYPGDALHEYYSKLAEQVLRDICDAVPRLKGKEK